MQNTFTPKAIEIVKQAIDFDNLGEYEKALELYRKALDFFMTGLKYEQNPTSRKMIMERVNPSIHCNFHCNNFHLYNFHYNSDNNFLQHNLLPAATIRGRCHGASLQNWERS